MVENVSGINRSMQNFEMPKAQEAASQKEETCFDDNDWTTNAADAVGKAFNNMDDFIGLFQAEAKDD